MSILPLWYALQIRSRYEHIVAGVLRAKGYEVFLPTYIDPKRVERILFGGYLFCRVSEGAAGKIVCTTHVLRIVGGQKPAPIDEVEIQNLRQIVRPHVRPQPHRYLPIGSRVRIESGPLTGVEGILSSVGDSKGLVVSIHLLQRSVAVILEAGTCLSRLHGQGVDNRPDDHDVLPTQFRESASAPVGRRNPALRSVA